MSLDCENNCYIHIFDDDKFIDVAIYLIEKNKPNISEYYVLGKKPFNYVKSDKVKPFEIMDQNAITNLCNEVVRKNPKAVFFHALDSRKQKIALELPKSIVLVWLAWGYDLYGNWKSFSVNLYEKQTRKLTFIKEKDLSFVGKILNSDFNLFWFKIIRSLNIRIEKRWWGKLFSRFYTNFFEAASKIDIFIPVIETENVFLKKMGLSPKFAKFAYGFFDESTTLEEQKLSKNIMIGNSADPSNNHLDIFESIKKINFLDSKILVPLNYGGTEEYKKKVIEVGYLYFGEKFEPIIDFIPLDEYKKVINSCGIFLFNHIRQQAMGNVLLAASKGGVIYLNKKSPVHLFLKKRGFKSFTIDQIKRDNKWRFLSEEERKNNREIFKKEYSEENGLQKVSDIYRLIDECLIEKRKS